MLSPEEQGQRRQTIEMFEVIVEANPHDCQSLEILKDAYTRLGMKKELMKVSRRMAQTFMELGQFATAILEYEQILRYEPDNPEIIAALGDCEERMHRATQAPASRQNGSSGGAGATEGGGLITTSSTHGYDSARANAAASGAFQDGQWAVPATDGNESLAKFLIQHKLVSEQIVNAALERVQKMNAALKPSTLGWSLLNEIVESEGPELEAMLTGIIDRTKFAYIPLEYYDVDRHVIRMLPEELTLKRLIVPFDVMSRTVMIAMANPFDAGGKEAAQSVLDYNIQWHVASPAAIIKVLAQAYKTGSAASASFQAASETPKSTEAPVFGEISVSIPIPELKVSGNNTPVSGSSDSKPSSPLPDTTDFRLKK
jgi:MshEN domain